MWRAYFMLLTNILWGRFYEGSFMGRACRGNQVFVRPDGPPGSQDSWEVPLQIREPQVFDGRSGMRLGAGRTGPRGFPLELVPR
jgi:hypothetical protein